MAHIPNQDSTNLLLEHYLTKGQPHLEITNECNIKCHYCANPTLKFHKGIMSLEECKIYMSRIITKEMKNITLCGYGEPFVNKNIYDIIDYLNDDLKLNVSIQTNGKWKLRDERIESLLKVKSISVTIDAIDQETFQLSRPKTDVSKILNNLGKVIELRGKFKSKTPLITSRMNVFEFNKQEVHTVITKSMELGIDRQVIGLGYGHPNIMLKEKFDLEEFDAYPKDFLVVVKNLVSEKPISQNSSKRTKRSLDLLQILYRTAVATEVGTAPSDHTSISQDCSECTATVCGGVKLDLVHLQGEHVSTPQLRFCNSLCSV